MDTEAFTVNQVLDQYMVDCFDRLAPRSQKDYRRHITILRETFGERIANDLVPRDFAAFMNVKRGKIHRNRTVAVLSAAFTHGVRKLYWMKVNVLRDVSRHRSQPRDRYVTDAEYEGFKALASPIIQRAMELALLLGQRQGDLLTMKWSQVQDMHILVTQSKTGKRLAIAITPAVEEVLDKCWRHKRRAEHVLCRRDGKAYTAEGFRAMLQRTMVAWKRKGNASFTFHDLRGKSASDSSTIELAYERLGHTDIALTRKVYDRNVRKVQPLR
jgi:integrase